VVLNLLINAIQAIAKEGSIDVRLVREQDCAVIHVDDTGRGISPDALPKILKPFFTTRSEGTGLGLSLANSIVQSHGGRIEVASVLQKGTQFKVWLPVERSARERSKSTVKSAAKR
jgi:signal transduction histidine kinase